MTTRSAMKLLRTLLVHRDLNNLYACPLVFVVDLNSKSRLCLPSLNQTQIYSNTFRPSYRRELLQLRRPSRSLRSGNHNLLNIPRPRTAFVAFVQWSFAPHVAPRVWNALPHTITDDLNISAPVFKSRPLDVL